MKFANKLLTTLSVVSTAIVALTMAPAAHAVGTAAGDAIDNVATVGYDVGGIEQTPIESSPAGNSTPGTGNGAVTQFLVDNRVDLAVVEVGGATTPVNPGEANVVTTFQLSNTGNAAQGYALTAANLTNADPAVFGNADTIDVNNVRVFADTDGSGTFTPADEAFVDTLAADASVLLFIVADVPIGASNGDFANVRVTATTAVAGTSGATVQAASTGGDTAGVDVVFGDADGNGLETADDGYEVSSAALSVTKAEAVISDPINGTTDPLHIPGAVVEYTITVVNTGSADATAVSVTDIIDTANLAISLGGYNGGASDISYVIAGGAAAFCTADAADADADNCGLSGSTLEADVAATLSTGDSLVVNFQVTIN